jgi:hypothetical protein
MLRAAGLALAMAGGHGVGAFGVGAGERDPRHRGKRRGQHRNSVSRQDDILASACAETM